MPSTDEPEGRARRCYGFFAGTAGRPRHQVQLKRLRPSEERCAYSASPGARRVEVKSRLAYVPDAVAFIPGCGPPARRYAASLDRGTAKSRPAPGQLRWTEAETSHLSKDNEPSSR